MRYVSVFSGIEAASCAWGPLGWEPLAFSEIEPFPCRVLEERFPGVPNLGDIARVDWEEFRDVHGPVDVLVGGSPCQSFSVAGKREGLEGASGLMWEWVRAVRGLRPEWAVWENVPGCLSSSEGADFRCLLDALDGLGMGYCWRTLDAQFFGVAQRRRRVFLVAHARAGRAAAVLLELSSLQGGARQGRGARALVAARAGGGSGLAGGVHGPRTGAGAVPEVENLTGHIEQDARVYGTSGVYPSLTCRDNGGCVGEVCGIAPNVIGRAPGNGGHQLGVDCSGAAYTLDTLPPQAVCLNQRRELRVSDAATVLADGPGQQSGWVTCREPTAFLPHMATGDPCAGPVSPCLFAGGCGTPAPAVLTNMVVRRLTPLECERLQGFPDGWTDLPGASDAERYRALGNSMAVPVMRWIGERIGLVQGEAGA